MQRWIVSLIFFLGLLSSPAWARFELECDRKQSFCLVEDKLLTVGDRVGLFNGYDEVVAVGVVNKMTGQRRRIKILKSYGRIQRGMRVALLDAGIRKVDTVEKRYDVYVPPKKTNFGGHIGLASLSIGEYNSGQVASGYGQWRSSKKYFQYVARGLLLNSQGRIGREDTVKGIEKQDMSMWGLGALGGIATMLRETRDISFRGEATAGLMYLDAQIGGSAQNVENAGFDSKVYNGIGPMLRIAASMQYNFQPWRAEALIAQSFVHEAPMLSIGLGMSRDID